MRFFEPLHSGEKVVSSLAELEVRSAIRRRQHSGDLSAPNAEKAITALLEESQHMMSHPLRAEVLELASAIVDRQNLRVLDAVQLSTAILASQTLGDADQFQFIASDKKLLRAAFAEGLDTWDPCDSIP